MVQTQPKTRSEPSAALNSDALDSVRCDDDGAVLGRERGRESWGGEDWAYASLAGVGAVLAGGLLLGLALLRVDDDEDEPREHENNDPSATTDVVLWAGGLALAFGGPAVGAKLYGDSQDFNGTWWGAVLGQVGGMALTVGASYVLADGLGMDRDSVDYLVAVSLSGAVLIPLSATAGYYASMREPWPPATASAGLLHITPSGEVRVGLALPRLNIAPNRDEARIHVPLLGGRF